MKNLLQNLLILFALALCALAAWQWNQEAKLRQHLQLLEADRTRHAATVEALQGDVRRLQAEVTRLDALRNTYADMTRTNETVNARLQLELQQSRTAILQSEKDAQAYQAALDKANASILAQNDSITAQNETAKKLAEERNEAVLRFNKLTEDFNALASQWNDLQERLGKTKPAGK